MSMLEHFKAECDLLNWHDPENFEDKEDFEMQQLIIANVNAVLGVISEQGHSGHSFPYFFNLLEKAANFKPLTPLTGADEEWNPVSEDCFQNRRDSCVFKSAEGAYFLDGYVFREPEGSCFTSKASRKPITFPWTHEKPVYVDVSEDPTPEEQEAAVRQYAEYRRLLELLEALPIGVRTSILQKGVKETTESLIGQDAPEPLSATYLAIMEQRR